MYAAMIRGARQFTLPGKLVDDLSGPCVSAWLKQQQLRIRSARDQWLAAPDRTADEKPSISGLAIVRSALSSDTLMTRQVSAWQRGYPLAQRSILDPLFAFPLCPSLDHSTPSIVVYPTVHLLSSSIHRFSQFKRLCRALAWFFSVSPRLSRPTPATLSLTPLCELSATGLCEEINRDPTPRSSADVPEEDKGTTTPGSLMFQRFHARAYPRYSRLVYASFREFYASRNKKDAGALTWKRERRVGIAG